MTLLSRIRDAWVLAVATPIAVIGGGVRQMAGEDGAIAATYAGALDLARNPLTGGSTPERTWEARLDAMSLRDASASLGGAVGQGARGFAESALEGALGRDMARMVPLLAVGIGVLLLLGRR